MSDTNTKPGGSQSPEYGGPMIKWDDVTIAHEAEHMPGELKELYLWLKVFVREHCHKDVDMLVTRLRELGIHRDKTTWSKILRGRWKRDARGDETVTPVVAAEKLIEEITALRNNQRIESMRGLVPFVETTTWEAIAGLIDQRRHAARVNKWGIIVGATGSQKTACNREYRNRNNHGTTVLVEAPEKGNLTELLRMLARAYGLASRVSITALRAQIFHRLSLGTAAERAQRCVIIDNAQELWLGERDSDQPAFTFLRRLQDTTGCTIILCITPLFERKLVAGMIEGWFEQIEGRSGGRNRWLRLPEFAPDEDVLAIAKAFGLREAKTHLKELVKISREPGRIRRLFEDLQEGKLLAGKDPFTWGHIVEARGDL
jgi:DNA transposition AAA+ family ATPase